MRSSSSAVRPLQPGKWRRAKPGPAKLHYHNLIPSLRFSCISSSLYSVSCPTAYMVLAKAAICRGVAFWKLWYCIDLKLSAFPTETDAGFFLTTVSELNQNHVRLCEVRVHTRTGEYEFCSNIKTEDGHRDMLPYYNASGLLHLTFTMQCVLNPSSASKSKGDSFVCMSLRLRCQRLAVVLLMLPPERLFTGSQGHYCNLTASRGGY